MKRVGPVTIVVALVLIQSGLWTQRLDARHESSAKQLARITIDYPADQSIFPPGVKKPLLDMECGDPAPL